MASCVDNLAAYLMQCQHMCDIPQKYEQTKPAREAYL